MKTLFLIPVTLLFISNFIYSQWIEQQSGVSVTLNCVSSLNSYESSVNGWVCGNNGTILSTTNGGSNWVPASGNILSTVNLTSILGMSNSYSRAITAGLTSNNTAVVYFTSNGGANWQNTFSQSGGQIYGFAELYSMYNILLIGKPVANRWTIWRSTNEGRTWDSTGLYLPQAGSEIGFNNSVFGLEGKAWFGTNNSRIYSTNGANWTIQSTSPEVNSSVIWFQFLLTDQLLIGFGLTSGAGMMKTTNLGVNWNSIGTTGSGVITGIAGSPSQFSKCWYSKGNKIYTSFEANNWTLEYTAPSGNFTNLTNNVIGSPNVWAVRDNGGISKYTGQIGIHTISSEVPGSFSLSQNYPNPFNPSTKIRFSIPYTSSVAQIFLSVYDILGRKVTTLVNRQLKPGTYEADWDASNYPSGLYFYKLISGEYSETKKMIILK